MEIGVKTLSQENSSNVIESTLAQLDLAEMSSVDVSLNLSLTDVVGMDRSGNDLTLELTNGEVVEVKGFFEENPDKKPNRLFLSEDDSIEYIDLTGIENAGAVAPVSQGAVSPSLVFGNESAIAAAGFSNLALAGFALGGATLLGAALDSGGRADQPAIPTLDALATDDATPVLTGTAEAGSTVDVVVNGTTFTTIAAPDGTFSIDTENDTPTAGGPFVPLEDGVQDIAVTSTDADGNVLTDDSTNELTIDTTAPDAPVITESNEAGVSGTAEPGSTVTVTIDGVEFTTTASDPDGDFTVTPPAGETFPVGADVTATATDTAGNVSTPADAVIADEAAPDAPVITESNEAGVSGTAEPGSTVTVTIDGVEFTTTASDPDGDFTVTPPAGETFPVGADVTATATGTAGNVSTPADVVIADETAPDAPIISTSNETEVSGTAEPGSTVTVVIGGEEFMATASEPDGQFVITPPAGETFEVDAPVTATATDAAGNESGPDMGTVDDETAPTVTIDMLVTGLNTVVTGTGEPNLQVEIFDSNGVSLGTTTTDGNGDFTFTPTTPLADDAVIEARQTDAAGNTGTAMETIVIDTDADSVRDTIDIDDDNDGILDTNEFVPTRVTGTIDPLDGNTGLFNDGLLDNSVTFSVPSRPAAIREVIISSNTNNGGAIELALVETNTGGINNLGHPVIVEFDTPVSDLHLDFRNLLDGTAYSDFIVTYSDGTSTLPGEVTLNSLSGSLTVSADGLTVESASGNLTIQRDGVVELVGLNPDLDIASVSFAQSGLSAVTGQNLTARLNLIIPQSVDSDGDGSLNQLDTDSDNAGMADHIEAQVGQTFINVPRDPDGNIINFVDADGDGLHDDYDADDADASAAASVGLEPSDSDADGTPDFADTVFDIDPAIGAALEGGTLTATGDADTIAFGFGVLALDLTAVDNGAFTNVETADLSGFEASTLTLELADLIDLSTDSDTLFVFGDPNDTVNAAGFTDTNMAQNINGTIFNEYTSGSATLLVEQDVTVVI